LPPTNQHTHYKLERFGSKVTLIDRNERLMSKED
jgi:hypothetical protein